MYESGILLIQARITEVQRQIKELKPLCKNCWISSRIKKLQKLRAQLDDLIMCGIVLKNSKNKWSWARTGKKNPYGRNI